MILPIVADEKSPQIHQEMDLSPKWWARRDLNPGPRDYESPALTAELQAPVGIFRAFVLFVTPECIPTGNKKHKTFEQMTTTRQTDRKTTRLGRSKPEYPFRHATDVYWDRLKVNGKSKEPTDPESGTVRA